MILFVYHKDNFDCNGRGVLHTYLVGLLVVLALIILSLCAVVYVSAQGKSDPFFHSLTGYLRPFDWVRCLWRKVGDQSNSVGIQVIPQYTKYKIQNTIV